MSTAALHTECAELVLSFLKDVQTGGITDLNSRIAKIVNTGEYQFILNRYRYMAKHYEEKAIPYPDEQLRLVFSSLATGSDYSFQENDFFEKLYGNLLKASGNLEVHEAVLKGLTAISEDYLLKSVAGALPEGTSFHTDIYFVPETHTNAYVFEGKVVVSFFPLLIHDNRVVLRFGEGLKDIRDAILCHELHHIGFGEVQNKHLKLDNLEPEETFILELIMGILGEGTATFFFSKPEEGYLLKLWNKTDQNRHTWFSKLGDFLVKNLADPKPKSELEVEAFQTFVESQDGMPPIYIIGTAMCDLIAEEFGENRLINLIEHPDTFFRLYNEAAAKRNGWHVFSPNLIDRISNLFGRSWS